MTSASSDAAPQIARQRPSWPRWTFRIASTVAAILLFDQAIYAGQFLSGAFGSLLSHRENSTLAGIGGVVVVISALSVRWPGGGPWWPSGAGLALFGLITLQIISGYQHWLQLHVPLGVAIVGLAMMMAAEGWRKKW